MLRHGPLSGPNGRCRQVLFNAMQGDTGRWEVIYRERGRRPLTATVHDYQSTSTRVAVDDLCSATRQLVEGGLRHRRRPLTSHNAGVSLHPLLAPTLVLAAAVLGVLALVMARSAGLPLLLTLVLAFPAGWALLQSLGWLVVRVARRMTGYVQ